VCKDIENQWASKLECQAHNVSAMHKEQAAWAAELEKEKKVTPVSIHTVEHNVTCLFPVAEKVK